MNKFWRSALQYCVYSQQFSIVHLKTHQEGRFHVKFLMTKERQLPKMEAKKNFQRGHIADCSDGFMSIHISSSSSNYPVKLYTLNMSSVFLYQLYLNKVVQKTKMQSL